jgi:release factor glutamine methyltransferase
MRQTLRSTLTQDKAALESALSLGAGTARIEVQMLLQHVLGVSRAHLLAHPEHELTEEQAAPYRAMLKRRLAGEPLAYILGEREFYGLRFKVTPATLIPRSDTELLVDLALQRIPREGGCRVLDLGTGSGAIALSIAHTRPNAEVTAVDASSAALEVALFNTRRLELKNVRLVQSHWFDSLAGERFDVIASNPPYIAAGDAHLSQGDVRFEPREALVSGMDGLDDIRHIIAGAREHLNSHGWMLLEHGYDQAAQVRSLMRQSGFASVFSARDLAGIERVSAGS